MAKVKADLSKSEEIRKIFAEKPDATAIEVMARLKMRNIVASEGLIYSLKPGKKKQLKAPKGKAKAAPSPNGALLSVGASIAVAKEAAEKVGWATLKQIVDALQ